jgi:hypothetical protein
MKWGTHVQPYVLVLLVDFLECGYRLSLITWLIRLHRCLSRLSNRKRPEILFVIFHWLFRIW